MSDELVVAPEPSPESETVTPEQAPAPTDSGSADGAPAAPPNVLPLVEEPKRYTGRFALAYTGLGIILAAALTGLIVLVIRPGYHPGPAWSSWKPPAGNAQKVTAAIADHIAHRYRLSENGEQLVAVIASKPQVTSGTQNIAIKAVAVRRAPQSNTGIAIYGTDKTQDFTLCGLGERCSIATGEATQTRGRLVRREALELALYTFKFAPAVDSVAAFMPPAPGQTSAPILYLRKDDLEDQLKQPLSKTLPLDTPPLPSAEDAVEKATIDKLTLPHMFSYELTALQTGGAALILDPLA
ncbi:MAG TPA: hypothetical protein VFB42_05485 [Gaiellaceae bacterium]|nr:hypothetical protein [Gaiellaceae bacterium]